MKYENLLNSLTALIVMTGAIMMILHIEHSNVILIFGLLLTNVIQSWIIRNLKNKLGNDKTIDTQTTV